MRDFLTEVALAGAAILLSMWLAMIGGRWMVRQLAAIRPYLAAFLVFTFVAMNYAQKSGTNEPPRGASSGRVESFDGRVECFDGRVEHVERVEGTNELMRTTEIAETAGAGTENGWGRIVDRFPQPPIRVAEGASVPSVVEMFLRASVATNDSYSFSMPSNGVRYVNWWLRGAYEDVFRLDLGEMRFPCGTNLCDSLWVYTWGMAGVRLGDASNRLVATGAPMSAVPGLSQFWSADVDGGAKLLTWENFFLNRDTNTLVSAQLELMPSGDFIARSNLVETVYRRVNPDDWDDDGIPNGDDLDPLSYDGDNFGPHQQLPEGANSNAYCWVDLVVAQADSLVRFVGDGYSALPDPTFIAKAGAPNRVIVLIGKTYRVTSRMPITCVGQSSGEIEVWQVSPMELSICWPVMIEASAMRGGSSFSMSVWPDWLGGGFTWTNSCCAVMSLGGWSYSITCGANCVCSGCGTEGYYGYESYRIPASGGSCGCWSDGEIAFGHDDEEHPAGVSVTFSKDAVIFEARHEESPGVWVNRRSTKVELTCVAHGGPNGGTATFLITGGNRLTSAEGLALPVIRNVPADTRISFTASYEGQLASAAIDDIVVNAYFDDNDPDEERKSAEATLTSVEIEIMKLEDAPNNDCNYRHKFGVCEEFVCNHWPVAADVSFGLGALTPGGSSKRYRCPLYALEKPMSVSYGGASYTPNISVVEPSGIQVRNPIARSYITSPGRAGWVGLKQEFYVLPLDVSFANIAMQEVPSTVGTHSGYFTNQAFSVIWCHSMTNGAGVWNTIDALTNKMGEGDTARITMELLRVDGSGNLTDNPAYGWADGEITWAVPFGWGVKPADTNYLQTTILHKQFDPNAGHRFLIVPDGTVSVRKFGNEATRDIQGHLYLNGVQCQ